MPTAKTFMDISAAQPKVESALVFRLNTDFDERGRMNAEVARLMRENGAGDEDFSTLVVFDEEECDLARFREAQVNAFGDLKSLPDEALIFFTNNAGSTFLLHGRVSEIAGEPDLIELSTADGTVIHKVELSGISALRFKRSEPQTAI